MSVDMKLVRGQGLDLKDHVHPSGGVIRGEGMTGASFLA